MEETRAAFRNLGNGKAEEAGRKTLNVGVKVRKKSSIIEPMRRLNPAVQLARQPRHSPLSAEATPAEFTRPPSDLIILLAKFASDCGLFVLHVCQYRTPDL